MLIIRRTLFGLRRHGDHSTTGKMRLGLHPFLPQTINNPGCKDSAGISDAGNCFGKSYQAHKDGGGDTRGLGVLRA
jgi:hypothetical protein